MAKPNYDRVKRQKEMQRKQKKQEKLLRKQARTEGVPGETPEGEAGQPPSGDPLAVVSVEPAAKTEP